MMPIEANGALDTTAPFLKWAGGKRWLTSGIQNFFPKTYNTYLEPFLGSAAIFFALQPSQAILSDINLELIETYCSIKNDWKKVANELEAHQRNHSKKYYYMIRKIHFRSKYSRAARFIYLNRTCWNGLYRVNLDGKFNVPIGTKSSVYTELDNFQRIAERLQSAQLNCTDFETTINRAKDRDLIFVDPPYAVESPSGSFLKYTNKVFSWNDQVRLKKALIRAKRRGAHIVLTNAFHPSIDTLYSDLGTRSILSRSSVISGKATGRGKYNEVIFKA